MVQRTIDITDLTLGVYFLNLCVENKNVVKKSVVKK